jgi:arginine decarboxylase-like protein
VAKESNPKEPKRALIAKDYLHDIVEQLHFFYQNEGKFQKEVLKKATYIEDVLEKLSIDKKSFSGKLKDIFGQKAEELKEENKELKEELKARGEKIGELVEEVKELKDET